MENFSKYFDHTLLRADASRTEILKLCREAEEYGFASVCVNGCNVSFAAGILRDTDVGISAVVDFPLGASSVDAKLAEASVCIDDGANEIDAVMDIGAMKDGRFDYIGESFSSLAGLCHEKGAILKVILETCLLTDEETVNACILAKRAGVDFVKTSTGFSTAGADVRHVKLMRDIAGDSMKVKASGGIRTLKDALAMIEAGADRLGCSASVSIMEEYENSTKKSGAK